MNKPAWLKRFSLSEIGYNLLMTAIIDGLLYLGGLAIKLKPDPWLFFISVIPLTLILLGVVGRVAPRRPVIVGAIEQIGFQNAAPGFPVGVLITAQVMNRGLPTSLDRWIIVAHRGEHQYIMRTHIPEGDQIIPLEGGEAMGLAQEDSLLFRTFRGIGRGQLLRGWLIADTSELQTPVLMDGATRFVVRCTDTFGKEWEITGIGKPIMEIGSLNAYPGLNIRRGTWTPPTPPTTLPPGTDPGSVT